MPVTDLTSATTTPADALKRLNSRRLRFADPDQIADLKLVRLAEAMVGIDTCDSWSSRPRLLTRAEVFHMSLHDLQGLAYYHNVRV